MKQSSLSVPPN